MHLTRRLLFPLYLGLVLGGGCTTSSTSATSDVPAPEAKEEAAGEGFISVGSGYTHGCALHSSGQVFCWGRNEQGQVGAEGSYKRTEPTPVMGITDAEALAVGGHHSCVLHPSGEVSCWGLSSRTGHLTSDDHASSMGSHIPRRVQAPGGVQHRDGRFESWCPGDDILRDIVALDAGNNHTCALHRSGQVVCWGGNTEAQSGGASHRYRSLQCPVPVQGISNAVELFAGGPKNCVVIDDGEVLCWGGERTTPFDWRDFDGSPGQNTWSKMRPWPQFLDADEIHPGDKMICARWADDSIRCFEESADGPGDEFHPPKDHLMASSPGLETCFLDPSHEMTCHSHSTPQSFRYPSWEETSPIRDITVLPGSDSPTVMAPVCALTEDHRLSCTQVMTTQHMPPASPRWREFVFDFLDDTPGVEEQISQEGIALSSPDDCPRELAMGNPEWPNHLHFERGGMSRTIYFEEVLAEYHDGLGRGPTDLYVTFPALRFDTASGDTARTDGWDAATVTGPLDDAGQSATMVFHYSDPSDTLGCFNIPPTRFGRLTFEESDPPTSTRPDRGRLAATFETTIGGDISGRLSGTFNTDNVFRDRTLPVDPDANISKGYPPPGSEDEVEEMVGTIGRALYRERDDQLTIEFGEEGELHGRTIPDFTGDPGVYFTTHRNTYRFHIETVEDGRIAGTMDTFINPPGHQPQPEEELKSLDTEPTSPVSMRFDLPLLRVQPPPALHLKDDHATDAP